MSVPLGRAQWKVAQAELHLVRQTELLATCPIEQPSYKPVTAHMAHWGMLLPNLSLYRTLMAPELRDLEE